MDFKKLNREELKDLLSELNTYKDMQKKLWKRWAELFKRDIKWENMFEVHFFPSISEDVAYDNALYVFKKVFEVSPQKKDIKFVPNKTLWWGIKVYRDDSMVDLSFSKVEKLLKK